MSKDGKPMCANCGAVGHHKGECPLPKAEPGKRPCFKCGKTGHTGAQCKSGLPAKIVEPGPAGEGDDEGSGATILVVHSEQYHPMVSGARHFVPEDSEDEMDMDDGVDESGDDYEVGCCRRECVLRGLRCTEEVFSDMVFELKQASHDVQGDIDFPADEAAAETSKITRWRRSSTASISTTTLEKSGQNM